MTSTARIISVAALAILPLTACGETEDELAPGLAPETVTVTETAPTPAPRPTTTTLPDRDEIEETVYLGTLDQADIYYTSEANAITAGRGLCRELDGGADVYDLGMIAMTSGGYTAAEAGTIVGAAIAAFCPEHSDQLE